MGNWKRILRYISDGEPTLLATFEETLAQQMEQVEVSATQLLKWYRLGRLEPLRAKLRHERPLDLGTMLQLLHFLGLSYDEAQARHFANMPPAKIGEFVATMRRIDAVNAAQLRRPCRRILVDNTAPQLVPTNFIYYPG
jgi:hypothetical protein